GCLPRLLPVPPHAPPYDLPTLASRFPACFACSLPPSSSLLAEFPAQPSPDEDPLLLHAALGTAEQLGYVLHTQAGEEPQLHDLRFLAVLLSQSVECLIQRQHIFRLLCPHGAA